MAEEKQPVDPAQPAVNETQTAPADPLADVTAERDKLRDQLLRTVAEMENVRKRLQRERDEERRYAALPVVRDLLPAIDNLQRALAAGEQDRPDDPLLAGVKMVLKQVEEVLSRHQIEPIPAVGQPFDPHLHEALQQVPSPDVPPMTVVRELERGFKIHDRVLRPSKVMVSGGG